MNFIWIKQWRSAGPQKQSFLWKLLLVILLPVFLVIFLIIMSFAAVLSLWYRLTITPQERLKQKEALAISQNPTWHFFVTVNGLKIERKLAGSLPYADNGDYFFLQSDPPIPYLEENIFGEWLYEDFGGVFLQKWNHERNINCDLIFIDAATLEVFELRQGIRSKDWYAEKTESGHIKFIFIREDGDLTYETGWPVS